MLKSVQVTCQLAYLNVFFYTRLPVKSYKQVQIYENGHFQLEYRFTLYMYI